MRKETDDASTDCSAVDEASEEEGGTVVSDHLEPARRARAEAEERVHPEHAGEDHGDEERQKGPVIRCPNGFVDPSAIVVVARHPEPAHRAHYCARSGAHAIGHTGSARDVA
eukprot:scaffold161746_cov32-Tisochrysis_lutea.AAC.2